MPAPPLRDSRCHGGRVRAHAGGLLSTHEDDDFGAGVTLTNEFTSVRVRVVRTRNGERLEIQSLRLPYSIRLDPLLLEALSWQDPLELGKALEEPFGPHSAAAAD